MKKVVAEQSLGRLLLGAFSTLFGHLDCRKQFACGCVRENMGPLFQGFGVLNSDLFEHLCCLPPSSGRRLMHASSIDHAPEAGTTAMKRRRAGFMLFFSNLIFVFQVTNVPFPRQDKKKGGPYTYTRRFVLMKESGGLGNL